VEENSNDDGEEIIVSDVDHEDDNNEKGYEREQERERDDVTEPTGVGNKRIVHTQ